MTFIISATLLVVLTSQEFYTVMHPDPIMDYTLLDVFIAIAHLILWGIVFFSIVFMVMYGITQIDTSWAQEYQNFLNSNHAVIA
jgi:hypothetical protein